MLLLRKSAGKHAIVLVFFAFYQTVNDYLIYAINGKIVYLCDYNYSCLSYVINVETCYKKISQNY